MALFCTTLLKKQSCYSPPLNDDGSTDYNKSKGSLENQIKKTESMIATIAIIA